MCTCAISNIVSLPEQSAHVRQAVEYFASEKTPSEMVHVAWRDLRDEYAGSSQGSELNAEADRTCGSRMANAVTACTEAGWIASGVTYPLRIEVDHQRYAIL